MIAFAFTFPGGRYHATPWGKHVNEADVAWPPEPVRILRALIATWWRKGDHGAFPKPMLDALIDALAAEAPLFHLPEAVHTHIRAFMPAPEAKRLIFDAFLKVRPRDRLVVAWQASELDARQEALAEHLLQRVGYLGRAESWAEGALVRDWDGAFNAAPRTAGTPIPAGSAPIDSMLARTPEDWRTERVRHLQAASSLKGAAARKVLDTLPAGLSDALSIDTGVWHAAGWSPLPPVLRKLVYDRPEIGPLPPSGRVRRRPQGNVLELPNKPEVARFVLAGRPRPRVEDTLRIGEVLRRALLARCPRDQLPAELLGRNAHGPLRDDPQHAHAFYLPEDADADGSIDHLTVYSRLGFSRVARRAMEQLTLLYERRGASADAGEAKEARSEDSGRKEWRVALDQLTGPDQIDSPLIGPSKVWVSATPYLRTRYEEAHAFGFEQQLDLYRHAFLREWRARRPGEPEPTIAPCRLDDADRFGVKVGTRVRSTLHFARTRRSGRGGAQPDAMGASLQLAFETPVAGPLAFGKHAHLGLGLFRRRSASD